MPEPGRLVVVKLGGSLIGAAELRMLLDAVAAAHRTVLVPGGGFFADAVRDAQGRLGFGDALAHRLALRAMGAFAAILAELDRRLVVASSRARIDAAHGVGRTPVWDPVTLEAGHPDIAESWDVTSDSLAAWLARELGAAALLLLKSASPARAGMHAAELAADGLVDAAFPAFAARFPGPIRCLGPADWPQLGEAVARPEASVGTAVRTGNRVEVPALPSAGDGMPEARVEWPSAFSS